MSNENGAGRLLRSDFALNSAGLSDFLPVGWDAMEGAGAQDSTQSFVKE